MTKAEEFAREAAAIIGDSVTKREQAGFVELFKQAMTLPIPFVDEKPIEKGWYGYRYNSGKIIVVYVTKELYIGKLAKYVECCDGRFTSRIRFEGKE